MPARAKATKSSPYQPFIEALNKKQQQLLDSFERDKAAGNALPDDGIQDLADKAASAYSKELNFSLAVGEGEVELFGVGAGGLVGQVLNAVVGECVAGGLVAFEGVEKLLLLLVQRFDERLVRAGLRCFRSCWHGEPVISLLVVRNVAHQRAGAVDLFHQDHAGQLMRERHRRKGKQLVGTLANRVVEPDIAAHDEGDAVRLVDGQSLQPLRKLQRIKWLTSLVENNRVALLRNRRQQAGRIAGADDSGILRALSTFLRRDFDDLDREEMLDSVEVTVNDRAELGVGSGTRPEET